MRRTDDLSLWPWPLTLEVTMIVSLGGHGACGWCGSSSSTRRPSLKFVGLGIWKIWRTMCVSINAPDDPDLWPFDLETGMQVASKVGNLSSKFWHARSLRSRIDRYVRDGQTDGRTKATLIAPSLRSGGIIICCHKSIMTKNSAVAETLRDASCHWIFC